VGALRIALGPRVNSIKQVLALPVHVVQRGF
jgi:hypothetical protein